ncbi:MAG: transketolase [Clostridia bacterium]|nr:transketolase [Clostridia bacterium]
MTQNELDFLKLTALKVRRHIIEQVFNAKSGHPGGSLSIADLVTYLYFREIKADPMNPADPGRDRFVLSKGHCAPALYAALAMRGFFPEEDLVTLRKVDSYLEGHPSSREVPGVDISTGSLGQGISNAVGAAIAGKLDRRDYRVYCILGDGECEEGQVWEAAMCAAHYDLDNLCCVVDLNRLQIDGETEKVMNPNPIGEKFAAFGWNVIQIDGHDFGEIGSAFRAAADEKGCPTVIIAETVKGKGVSFMENKASWHGVAPNAEETAKALQEIDNEIKKAEVQNG